MERKEVVRAVIDAFSKWVSKHVKRREDHKEEPVCGKPARGSTMAPRAPAGHIHKCPLGLSVCEISA